MKALATALGLAATAGTLQAQQDAAAVRQAVQQHYAAINAMNTDQILQQHLPNFSMFAGDGGVLWSFTSHDQQRREFSAGCPCEFKVTIRDLDVSVYGNAAVAMYYLAGSVRTALGAAQGTWRVSEVWIRQGTEWKEAHHHESPLLNSVVPLPTPPGQR